MISRLALSVATLALVAGCESGGSQSSLPVSGLRTAGVGAAHATEKVLYSFAGGTDGGGPVGSIVFDPSGNAFGTTHFGGISSCGGNVGG
ncbi:MAG: hypothetical protein WBV67_08175, partial [Candidatus Cybelea sp.]